MEIATQIIDTLKEIKRRNNFTDQQLAEYVGVSRWTLRRICKGEIGETVSTSLVGAVLKERTKPIEQAA